MKNKNTDSAFPRPESRNANGETTCYGEVGLTKREYLAATVAAGLVTHKSLADPVGVAELSRVAKRAVVLADKLLEELAK